MSDPDVVIVGSGPNGLAAAVALAQGGASTLVLEARETIGGGTRTAELTLPGFSHDVCSAVHPMAVMSPFFRSLPLEKHGLRWIRAPVSVAHPLDDQPAVLLHQSIDATLEQFGTDAARYRSLLEPFIDAGHDFFRDLLAPLRIPEHPLLMLRFGIHGVKSAVRLAKNFETSGARALLAGCAAHSCLALERAFTGAVGLVFLLSAHLEDWPIPVGGSQAITGALARLLLSLGGTIQTNAMVRTAADLPPARMFLFDTNPTQLASIASSALPTRYLARLRRYRYGPGVFKVDWALDGPIPWRDPRCLQASTVHVGGMLEEIAASESGVWSGEHSSRPFLLVCQQSDFDSGRAPPGKRTGYAYCHVPAGSKQDRTEVVEAQIERFAPGFRARILARHATLTADFERDNPNLIGGAITGGAADAGQLFTRPVARFNPYTTPNPRVLLCSSSTPPGGGVHGMCGYHAARTALKRLSRIAVAPLVP